MTLMKTMAMPQNRQRSLLLLLLLAASSLLLTAGGEVQGFESADTKQSHVRGAADVATDEDEADASVELLQTRTSPADDAASGTAASDGALSANTAVTQGSVVDVKLNSELQQSPAHSTHLVDSTDAGDSDSGRQTGAVVDIKLDSELQTWQSHSTDGNEEEQKGAIVDVKLNSELQTKQSHMVDFGYEAKQKGAIVGVQFNSELQQGLAQKATHKSEWSWWTGFTDWLWGSSDAVAANTTESDKGIDEAAVPGKEMGQEGGVITVKLDSELQQGGAQMAAHKSEWSWVSWLFGTSDAAAADKKKSQAGKAAGATAASDGGADDRGRAGDVALSGNKAVQNGRVVSVKLNSELQQGRAQHVIRRGSRRSSALLAGDENHWTWSGWLFGSSEAAAAKTKEVHMVNSTHVTAVSEDGGATVRGRAKDVTRLSVAATGDMEVAAPNGSDAV